GALCGTRHPLLAEATGESVVVGARTKVVLPRRVKADLADEALAAAILFGPLLLGQALVGSVPDLLLRVTIVAFPAAILYTVFRDAVGGGVSLGKRALGLTIIRLVDGRRCTARHVWARNLHRCSTTISGRRPAGC